MSVSSFFVFSRHVISVINIGLFFRNMYMTEYGNRKRWPSVRIRILHENKEFVKICCANLIIQKKYNLCRYSQENFLFYNSFKRSLFRHTFINKEYLRKGWIFLVIWHKCSKELIWFFFKYEKLIYKVRGQGKIITFQNSLYNTRN